MLGNPPAGAVVADSTTGHGSAIAPDLNYSIKLYRAGAALRSADFPMAAHPTELAGAILPTWALPRGGWLA